VYFLFLESAAARWIGLAVALLLAAVIIVIHGVVYLHWVFSLPALLVGDRSAASALTYTHDPLREMKRRVGVVVFSFWTVIILLPFALAQGFHSVGGRVFTRLSEDHRLVMPVVLTLMAGYLATSFIGEFLTVTVNSLTITRLYAGLRQTRGAKKGDSVLVRTKASQQERREEEEFRLSSGVAKPVAPCSSRHPHPRQIVAFMVLAAVVSLATAATILSNIDLRDNVKITAHRGGSFSAPENTLAAIYRAIEEGADCAEVDVRLTADGYAVLLHDKDLFRVAGVKKSLSELTYEAVKGGVKL
jgi:glycerophosphoryl diester phosphodiesterase